MVYDNSSIIQSLKDIDQLLDTAKAYRDYYELPNTPTSPFSDKLDKIILDLETQRQNLKDQVVDVELKNINQKADKMFEKMELDKQAFLFTKKRLQKALNITAQNVRSLGPPFMDTLGWNNPLANAISSRMIAYSLESPEFCNFLTVKTHNAMFNHASSLYPYGQDPSSPTHSTLGHGTPHI